MTFKKDLFKTRWTLCLGGEKNRLFFFFNSDCALVSTVRRAEFISLALFVVPQERLQSKIPVKVLALGSKRKGRAEVASMSLWPCVAGESPQSCSRCWQLWLRWVCTEVGRSRRYRLGINSVCFEWSSCFILKIHKNMLFAALSLANGAEHHSFDETIQTCMLSSLKNKLSPNKYKEVFCRRASY